MKIKTKVGGWLIEFNYTAVQQRYMLLSINEITDCHYWSLLFFSGGSGGLNVKTQPESRCPELLANFCDMLLRKTPYSKKLTSDEIQAKLKDVVSIVFCYIK